MIRVCIVGAGAVGLATTARLIQEFGDNIDIDIYEKNPKIGRKILASGNGRCNISNTNIFQPTKYNDEFATKIVLSNAEYLAFFRSIGLEIGKPDEEGRMYPITNHSSSVVDCFNKYVFRPNVHLYLNVLIDKIKSHHERYLVNNKIYDFVVICCGSYAGEKTKENPIKDSLLSLGHHSTKTFPSIGPIKIKENLKVIEGIRCDCKVSLNIAGSSISSIGEILFKKDELSGICVSELTTIMSRLKLANIEDKNAFVSVDLLPEIKEADLTKMIEERMKNFGKDYLLGLFHSSLASYIQNRASSKEANKVAHLIKNLTFRVNSDVDSEIYHVVVGGFEVSEITEYCESKILPNVYLGGEMLNIDGACGGFNLHFAFSCGVRIADSIIKKS